MFSKIFINSPDCVNLSSNGLDYKPHKRGFIFTTMENKNEIWKDIPGYYGRYQASNLGNIKSVRPGKEILLKLNTDKQGYYYLVLHYKGFLKSIKVHQLVAMAFLGHTPCGYRLVVNHINHNPKDNRVENLEIISHRENTNRKHLKSSSKYTGVNWDSLNKKWHTQIFANGKNRYIGYFDDEKEASEYYENAVKAIKNGDEIVTKKPSFSSGFKGVTFSKALNKWMAYIIVGGKQKYLGYYKAEMDAYLACKSRRVYFTVLSIINPH